MIRKYLFAVAALCAFSCGGVAFAEDKCAAQKDAFREAGKTLKAAKKTLEKAVKAVARATSKRNRSQSKCRNKENRVKSQMSSACYRLNKANILNWFFDKNCDDVDDTGMLTCPDELRMTCARLARLGEKLKGVRSECSSTVSGYNAEIADREKEKAEATTAVTAAQSIYDTASNAYTACTSAPAAP